MVISQLPTSHWRPRKSLCSHSTQLGPASATDTERQRKKDRQTDGGGTIVRTFSLSFFLLLGLLCLGLGSPEGKGSLGSEFGIWRTEESPEEPPQPHPKTSIQALRANDPPQSARLPPSWLRVGRSRSGQGEEARDPALIHCSPQSPVPPHNPLTCPPGSAQTAHGC